MRRCGELRSYLAGVRGQRRSRRRSCRRGGAVASERRGRRAGGESVSAAKPRAISPPCWPARSPGSATPRARARGRLGARRDGALPCSPRASTARSCPRRVSELDGARRAQRPQRARAAGRPRARALAKRAASSPPRRCAPRRASRSPCCCWGPDRGRAAAAPARRARRRGSALPAAGRSGGRGAASRAPRPRSAAARPARRGRRPARRDRARDPQSPGLDQDLPAPARRGGSRRLGSSSARWRSKSCAASSACSRW